MKKTILFLFMITLILMITGCTGITGNAARPPPSAPSGGGCGVAAPVDQPVFPADNSFASSVRAPAL